MSSMLQNLATFHKCKLSLPYSKMKLSRMGFKYSPETALIQCSNCAYDITNSKEPIETTLSGHAKWGPNCPLHNINNSIDKNEYDSCIESLKSFGLIGPKEHGQLNDKLNNRETFDEGFVDSEITGCISAPFLNVKDTITASKKQGQNIDQDEVDSVITYHKSPLFENSEDVIKVSDNKFKNLEFQTKSASSTREEGIPSSSNLERALKNIAIIVERPEEKCNDDVVDSTEKAANTFNLSHSNEEASVRCNSGEINETFLIRYSKHPIMASTEERRETFKGQEQKYKHCERASVEDFIAAGLFYVGPEDNVRCFFCDGGLRNVQSHNVPFEEHKRWFPDCAFMAYLEKQQKNVKTNAERRLQRDDLQPSLSSSASSSSSALETIYPSIKIPGRCLEAREVKARLETSVVQRLMSQGFLRQYLKRAIERRFVLHGDDFTSGEELIQDILEVEGDKALPRNNQHNSANQATAAAATAIQNSDVVDGASAAGPAVRTATTSTASKLLGTGKDLLAAEADIEVNETVKSMKASDVHNTLKNRSIEDEELRRLWLENQELSQVRTCKICLDREINTVFLPCGHFMTCDKCCPKISHCCICRAVIRGTVLALSAISATKDAVKGQ